MPRSWRGGATARPLVLEAPPPPQLSRGPQVHGLRVPADPQPAQSSPLILSRSPGPALLWAFQQCALGFEKGLQKLI